MSPVIFGKLVLSRHDFALHVLRNLLAWSFRIKRRVATQHDIDDDAKGPHVTALKADVTLHGCPNRCHTVDVFL